MTINNHFKEKRLALEAELVIRDSEIFAEDHFFRPHYDVPFESSIERAVSWLQSKLCDLDHAFLPYLLGTALLTKPASKIDLYKTEKKKEYLNAYKDLEIRNEFRIENSKKIYFCSLFELQIDQVKTFLNKASQFSSSHCLLLLPKSNLNYEPVELMLSEMIDLKRSQWGYRDISDITNLRKLAKAGYLPVRLYGDAGELEFSIMILKNID